MVKVARIALPWVIAALVAVAVGSTFAPWFRSGDVTRTSYETIRTAARLDLLDGSAATVARFGWSFVPLMGCLAVLALLLEHRRVGALFAAIVGAASVALAAVVSRAPDNVEWGATVSIVAGLALLVASVLLLSTPNREGSPEQQ
ncbi:MAG: hypothetical protein KDB02_02660 [Acidimicrobiales bacterium]|nr:hypothetical protein [Acidimicrobiales bacterium]